ncbi:MAG: CoA transferase, partial [Chloroflexi bacterium]|nr:CoA transferase [Chloroflexota bacterium]
AALLGRERAGAVRGAGGAGAARGAGGRRIDVSLLESSLAVLINQAQNAFVTGQSPRRRGNAHPSIVPYETFAAADGEIAVGVGSQKQWLALCTLLGQPPLADDPRFATNGARVEHRSELISLLGAAFAGATSAMWLARLEAVGIPCGPILDVVEAFEAPQARALGSRVPVQHPVLGSVDQVASPIRFEGLASAVRVAPPLAGEHADEILREAGYSDAEIERLATEGVT